MKTENIQRLVTHGYAFDTETHLIQRGLLAPPIVCASVAKGANAELLTPVQALDVFTAILQHSIFIAANAPYDALVMAVYAASQGVDLMPAIFKAYDDQRVYDVQVAEQLHALAEGHMGKFPNGSVFPYKNGKPQSYNLDMVTELVLGRTNAKANDRWRLSYALLADIPMEEWPEEARTYPLDDVINPHEIAVRQATRNRNLHDLARQCQAHWALQLGAAWGFTVDPPRIAELKRTTAAKKLEGQAQFLECGLLKTVKEKGELVIKKDQPALKKRVADAYGCSGTCEVCLGWGKIPGATKCPKRKCGGDDCQICRGSGFKPKGCKWCDGTGYDLDSAPVPRTEGGGVGAGRDPLYESGDEDLINFAAWTEADKITTTYIPWLERGVAEDGSVIPLNPRPSLLKETGRIGASTEHQLPRGGGVRECIKARDGWMLISCDYEGAELVTHAQSCLNIVGWSEMADALNGGIKVHDKLGAEMIGTSYENMIANRKTDKRLGDARQAAKPLNFGLPGLMGEATLVLQQRKQGPDTTAPCGKVYKGLRFCLLAGASVCGAIKVTEWKGRPIPPTCVDCLNIAKGHKATWLKTWPENVEYFEHVKRTHEGGEMVQHFSGRVRAGMTLCSTANSWFQGLAADIMKLALYRVAREQYVDKSSDLYGSRTIIPIHDEVIMEARIDQASAAAKRLGQVMVEVMIEACPDMAATANAEPALMRRMYKGAEPVYNDTGDLIPWEPTG